VTNPDGTKLALYPGTFDPITNGHLSLIERATKLFDRLIVAVAAGGLKQPFFTLEERVELVQRVLAERRYADRVEVIGFDGLVAKLALERRACALIRGLRAVSDFDYEFQMTLMNRKQARSVETVFLLPALSWVYLSSTMVKDVALHGGDISGLVPSPVKQAFDKKRASTG